MSKAILLLQDGTRFEGEAFGVPGVSVGQLRPFTGMADYLGLLTDPASSGRIYCMTYPSIGNYGVNTEDCESGKVYARGLIVRDICPTPSNWRSVETVDYFLKRNLVSAISGIDTRALTRHLRRSGPQNAAICTTPGFTGWQALSFQIAQYEPECAYPAAVSEPTTVRMVKDPVFKVALCDFGSSRKLSLLLARLGLEITLLPPDDCFARVAAGDYHGLVLPDGPGEPGDQAFLDGLHGVMASGLPVLGLGLGFRCLLAAEGFQEEVLPFGHWGANQPVFDHRSGRTAITRQMHDRAMQPEKTDKSRCDIIMTNGNDHTVEGLAWKNAPVLGAYYQPASLSAAAGGHLLNEFCSRMKR